MNFNSCNTEECHEKLSRLEGIGSGVFEIVIRNRKKAYRCIQAVQLGRKVYVLHAFQKKSSKGIKTPKQHVDLIKQCYKEATKLASNEE